MIKAEELRIGNWIWNIKTDQPFRVDVELFRTLDNLIFHKIIKPIPITPQILERNRFDREDEYYELRGEDFWIKEVGLLKYQFVSGTKRIGDPFSFVHKLQNLYYALTGEDLEIKL